MTSRFTQVSVVLLALLAFHPANALVIEITYPETDLVRAALFEIDAVDDRAYTVRLGDDGTVTITFGDGVQGARPSSGGGVVASYRNGAGNEGNIVNEYRLTDLGFPFIPILDFLDKDTGLLDVSFVIVGLTSLTFEFSPDGLRVLDAEITSPVPEPGTLALLGIGLFGIGLARRRKSLG